MMFAREAVSLAGVDGFGIRLLEALKSEGFTKTTSSQVVSLLGLVAASLSSFSGACLIYASNSFGPREIRKVLARVGAAIYRRLDMGLFDLSRFIWSVLRFLADPIVSVAWWLGRGVHSDL